MQSHQPEDLEDLVDLGVSREERMTLKEHLSKDAAYTPHVNGGGIMSRPEQDFGRSVPQSHHLNEG